MSFTLAGKYKVFHSIFMMLGVALLRRSQAEKMLEEENIMYPGQDSRSDNYSVPHRHKKEVKNLGHDLDKKKSKRKSRKGLGSKSKSKKKFKRKQLSISKVQSKNWSPNISPLDRSETRQPKFTTKMEGATTQERLNKLRFDLNDVDKLVIVESDSRKDANFSSTFGWKKPKEEQPPVRTSDNFDLFNVKRVKKERKVRLRDVDKRNRDNEVLDYISSSHMSVTPTSKAQLYSNDKR